MGLFTVQKSEAKVIIIEQLKDEVIADGTIAAEADTIRIVNDAGNQYYFEFDDTAYDNNSALSGAADTALQAVIDAHVPAGNPPTEPPLNGLRVKAGRVAAGSFTGSPREATVTFYTPYETYETYVVSFSVRGVKQKHPLHSDCFILRQHGFYGVVGNRLDFKSHRNSLDSSRRRRRCVMGVRGNH